MTIRARVRVCETYACTAPDELFTDAWETDCDAAVLATVERQRGLPCDGGGHPGEWCRGCAFGVTGSREEEEVPT